MSTTSTEYCNPNLAFYIPDVLGATKSVLNLSSTAPHQFVLNHTFAISSVAF